MSNGESYVSSAARSEVANSGRGGDWLTEIDRMNRHLFAQLVAECMNDVAPRDGFGPTHGESAGLRIVPGRRRYSVGGNVAHRDE
jgi:hypothetical protein